MAEAQYMNKVIDKKIPTPCINEVNIYLSKWNDLESYVAQEDSLTKLFAKTYPQNVSIDEVLIKVAVLNDFYSTNIFKTYNVAKRIVDLKIDTRLAQNDVTLVNDIAKVDVGDGKMKNFYSFATKYCSHHKPLDYPIYDSFVDKVLCYFRRTDKFSKFKNNELKDYAKFKNVLIEFRTFYNLEEFSLKDIDKYIWQLGKEVFPKSY